MSTLTSRLREAVSKWMTLTDAQWEALSAVFELKTVGKNDLFQRIPQYHVASYLGISDVHLSRIRRDVVRNQQ